MSNEKARELAKAFCKDWPTATYTPHDLELFYEKGYAAGEAVQTTLVNACADSYRREVALKKRVKELEAAMQKALRALEGGAEGWPYTYLKLALEGKGGGA